MKIVGFELENWERDIFQEIENGHELRLTGQPVNNKTAEEYRDADIISTFVYSSLSAEVLEHFYHLKLIATRSTGYNHIDIDYCREHGISVSSVPEYGDETVAEHVFALLLAISRSICEASRRTRSGDFSQQGLQGFDLSGKTMGVIGTGNIGKNVIRIARGFNMKILAFDIRPDEQTAKEQGFRYTDMEEVLSGSDVVTIHVPGNEKTRNMISDRQFEMMKPKSVLINTARGDIVNTRALLESLTNGKLAAAGIDVLPEESSIREEAELLRTLFSDRHDLRSLFASHMLIHRNNVLVTPHSAFNTKEAVERLLRTSIENILSFVQGQPQNVVVQGKPFRPQKISG